MCDWEPALKIRLLIVLGRCWISSFFLFFFLFHRVRVRPVREGGPTCRESTGTLTWQIQLRLNKNYGFAKGELLLDRFHRAGSANSQFCLFAEPALRIELTRKMCILRLKISRKCMILERTTVGCWCRRGLLSSGRKTRKEEKELKKSQNLLWSDIEQMTNIPDRAARLGSRNCEICASGEPALKIRLLMGVDCSWSMLNIFGFTFSFFSNGIRVRPVRERGPTCRESIGILT